MRRTRDFSIQRKLTLLMMLASSVALLVASAAFVANHYATLRSSTATELVALADVLASNSTATLSFHQATAAQELLASLARRPTVEYACLFDRHGNVFASYRRDDGIQGLRAVPNWLGHRFDQEGYLSVCLPVAENGDVLGRIVIRATTGDLRAQFYRDLGITVAVILMSLAVVVLVSARLQRVVSRPILDLAAAARRITEQGDYSIRVQPASGDEIGSLYRPFNLMLDRIQNGEDALRSERDHSASIVNTTPAIVCGILPDGTTSFINPAGEQITGYRANELVGRIWWEVLYPGKEYRQVERLFEDLRHGEVRDYEMTLTTKQGEKRTVSWNSRKRCDRDGNLVELFGFGNDITERKRAADEREQLIVQMEARNAELEQFAYTVSHDLKTPLITIKGYVGLLKQDLAAGNAEAVRDDLRRIADAGNRMHQLLSQVLELSRIGRVTHPPEDVGLADLAQEAVALLHGVLSRRKIEVQIAPQLPVLHGDRIRLVEVLQNLIENAAKYMGDQPEPRIKIGARRDGDEVVCYVQDNGTGIDPRYHEKVFGLFDQLDQKAEGSGVGLALVKRIVEVHGGRVWVESEGEGRGSTFCFTIQQPVPKEEAAPSPTGAVPQPDGAVDARSHTHL